MTQSGVWYRFRAEARGRLGAWIMLGATFGLGAGAVLAAVAGASRTSSAYDRFFEAQHGLDAVVLPVDYCETCDVRRAEDLPMVRDSVRILSANVAGARVNGREVEASSGAFLFAGTTDGRIGRELNQWHLLEGRLPDPTAPQEILVSRDIATRMPLYVDDHLEVDFYVGPFGEEEIKTLELEVVGIEVSPVEFEPLSGGAVNIVHTGPAFAKAHPEVFPVEVLGVVLQDRPDARGALERALAPLDLTIFPLIDSERQAAAARDRFRDNAAGLLVLAGLGALTVLVLTGQALHRQHGIDAVDRDRLSAIGWGRRELRRVAWLRSGVVALAGTASAVIGAAAVSPLTPVGEARAIEPHPGVNVDATVLGRGALSVLVALLLIGALAAEGPIRAGTGASLHLPTSVVAIRQSLPGLRLRLASALGYERSGRAVPLTSVVTGLLVAIIAVAGAATFAVGLDHLEHTPALYGQPWDAVVVVEDAEDYLETAEEQAIYEAAQRGEDTEASFELLGDIVPERAARQLAGQTGIEAVSLGTTSDVVIDGHTETGSLSLSPITGDLQASLISGRLPAAEDEVAMGSRLLAHLGLELGDTVAIGAGDGPDPDASQRRIVGRTVTANLGLVDALGGGIVEPGRGGDLIFLTFSTPAAQAALMDGFHERGLATATAFDQEGRLLDLGGAQATPSLVAGLTAVLGLATLVHFGVVAAGRHAHHFGVLRALGLRRRDCRSVLVWHGLLVGGLALAIGVPVGIAVGRATWLAYANGLFVVPRPRLPEPWFAALPVIAVVLIALAMAVPAHLALRHSAAEGLRSE